MKNYFFKNVLKLQMWIKSKHIFYSIQLHSLYKVNCGIIKSSVFQDLNLFDLFSFRL